MKYIKTFFITIGMIIKCFIQAIKEANQWERDKRLINREYIRYYRCTYENPDKRIGIDGKEPEWKE
jgi:hypothetical protein